MQSFASRPCLSSFLTLVLLLTSIALASAQTVINALPYTINTKGLYVRNDDLTFAQTSGTLIAINASNVTIDLQGHYLSGPTTNNDLYGIYANERANLTVRNGTISHCAVGIYLAGNGDASTTNNLNHAIDNLRVSHCSYYGVNLNAALTSTITNCKISQIGVYGIVAKGAGTTVQGCVVSQVTSSNQGAGIYLDAGAVARQNTVAGCYYGVLGTGLYQDSLATGCTTAFYGGVDAGGNFSN